MRGETMFPGDIETAALLLWNINCTSNVKILIAIILQMVLLRKLSELFVTYG